MPKREIKAGLVGLPISKSLSRVVFAAFSRLLGEEIVYLLIECDAEDLGALIGSLKPNGWAGFNVTLPYKKKVFSMLNLADPAAAACGAVNCARFGRAGLEGTNTDAHALRHALEEADYSAAGRSAAVFGSGGSAASSGWALGRACAARVTFHARNAAAAAELAARLSAVFPKTAYAAAGFEKPAGRTDIFVNATPLGMYEPGRPPCEPGPGALCMDLAYAKEGTDLCRAAAGAGAGVVDGLSLLVWQAALSLQYWTGLPAGDIVKFKQDALALLKKEF